MEGKRWVKGEPEGGRGGGWGLDDGEEGWGGGLCEGGGGGGGLRKNGVTARSGGKTGVKEGGKTRAGGEWEKRAGAGESWGENKQQHWGVDGGDKEERGGGGGGGLPESIAVSAPLSLAPKCRRPGQSVS